MPLKLFVLLRHREQRLVLRTVYVNGVSVGLTVAVQC